ncbi:MAG TPA: flagellar hook-basal body protein [Ramlibacter sp.]|nr:flagellar hook-basal body protein [Ramlibacter sp.]
MDEILAVALQSMQGDMARVEQIGMNLANALTPGYKRGIALQAPLGASFASHLAGASAAAGAPATGGMAPLMSFPSDSRAGTLKHTGQSLDLALAGQGYFEIATDNGPAYTRQGNFRVDAAGRLVTAQGHPVMGHAGEIVLATPNPVVHPSGAIVGPGATEDAPLAQLKIVEFEAGAPAQRAGDGLVSANSGVSVLPAAQVQLRQGYLENANVVSTQEMTHLIQAMRHFEAMQKMTQGYDDMLGTAIRKLGETS